MKILDKEIDFDFFDAEQMKKYEEESEIAQAELKKLDHNKMKMSEYIFKMHEVIEKCFDNIFGEGTSNDIFKGKKNVKLCVEAFSDFAKARNEQEKELKAGLNNLQKELDEIDNEYKVNREKKK